jgi:hypothetical protein
MDRSSLSIYELRRFFPRPADQNDKRMAQNKKRRDLDGRAGRTPQQGQDDRFEGFQNSLKLILAIF